MENKNINKIKKKKLFLPGDILEIKYFLFMKGTITKNKKYKYKRKAFRFVGICSKVRKFTIFVKGFYNSEYIEMKLQTNNPYLFYIKKLENLNISSKTTWLKKKFIYKNYNLIIINFLKKFHEKNFFYINNKFYLHRFLIFNIFNKNKHKEIDQFRRLYRI